MALPIKIPLQNRDNLHVELQLDSSTDMQYRLVMDDYKFIRCCFSEGFDKNDPNYEYLDWIDPPGGPMLYVGMVLDEKTNLHITEVKMKKNMSAYESNIFIKASY